MDDTVEKVITGLIVAAISGLTFIAYKHPRAYGRLHLTLSTITLYITLSMVAWNVSTFTVAYVVKESKVAGDKTTETINVILSVAAPHWWFLISVGVTLYLWFLYSFRWWLEDEIPKRVNNQE
jgi:hypothetical protein